MQFRRNSSLFRQQNWYTSLFLLFSHSAMSDSLQLHGLQQDRLPGPSVSPRICSKSCPLSQWCHPTFSTCLLLLLPSIFSSIRVFSNELARHISGQSIGVPTSALDLPMNIQGWFPLGLNGVISLLSKELSRVFSNTTVWKHQFFDAQLFCGPALPSVYDYWKNHSFD